MVNIQGLDKAEVLLELYNHSHQQGLGMIQPLKQLTIDDCRLLLEEDYDFDYLFGKVMKVNLSSDEDTIVANTVLEVSKSVNIYPYSI